MKTVPRRKVRKRKVQRRSFKKHGIVENPDYDKLTKLIAMSLNLLSIFLFALLFGIKLNLTRSTENKPIFSAPLNQESAANAAAGGRFLYSSVWMINHQKLINGDSRAKVTRASQHLFQCAYCATTGCKATSFIFSPGANCCGCPADSVANDSGH